MKDRPELDDKRNLELLCDKCHHDGYVNSYEHRVEFWQRQCKRYADMREWYEALAVKVKEKFE